MSDIGVDQRKPGGPTGPPGQGGTDPPPEVDQGPADSEYASPPLVHGGLFPDPNWSPRLADRLGSVVTDGGGVSEHWHRDIAPVFAPHLPNSFWVEVPEDDGLVGTSDDPTAGPTAELAQVVGEKTPVEASGVASLTSLGLPPEASGTEVVPEAPPEPVETLPTVEAPLPANVVPEATEAPTEAVAVAPAVEIVPGIVEPDVAPSEWELDQYWGIEAERPPEPEPKPEDEA